MIINLKITTLLHFIGNYIIVIVKNIYKYIIKIGS
jgi:hypothetical protein